MKSAARVLDIAMTFSLGSELSSIPCAVSCIFPFPTILQSDRLDIKLVALSEMLKTSLSFVSDSAAITVFWLPAKSQIHEKTSAEVNTIDRIDLGLFIINLLSVMKEAMTGSLPLLFHQHFTYSACSKSQLISTGNRSSIRSVLRQSPMPVRR
ncbi:hypothetical protein D3C80_1171010 [compost metagenome]